jgi:hypothetical protein
MTAIARPARFFVAVFISGLLSAPCSAQQRTTVADPGARVRIFRTGSQVPQDATLLEFGHDSVIVQPGGCCTVDTIPLSLLTAVDVSRGVSVDPGHVLGGMALGLMAGVAAGWTIGAVACKSPDAGELCGIGAIYWATILGAGGLTAGALWGMESKVERWDRIYPPRRASIFVAPNADRGFSIGVVIPLDVALLYETR